MVSQHTMNKTLKSPNPKDFFQIRRLPYEAPHLEYIDLPFAYNIETSLEKWIVDHLKNRFYLHKTMSITKDDGTGPYGFKMRVGFEDPKEMSYFVLACPLLKYK